MQTTSKFANYDEIKSSINTYDLFTFRSKDVVSDTICVVENCSLVSHVGIAVRGESLMPPFAAEQSWLSPEKLFIFESVVSGPVYDGVYNVWGKTFAGVQLRDFDAVIANHRGTIGWCPLLEMYRCSVNTNFRHVYQKFDGIQYDASFIDLMASADMPGFRRLRDNSALKCIRDTFCSCTCCGARGKKSQWLFCSELVANVYKEVGLIKPQVNCENVMPSDFLTDPTNPRTTRDLDKEIPVLFGPQTYIRYRAI